MMDGFATATMVASTRIMKKPTIIAQSARHGSATGAVPPAGLPRSAVVISPTSSRLLPMVSTSVARRQRNQPVLKDFTKPGSRGDLPVRSGEQTRQRPPIHRPRGADVPQNPCFGDVTLARSYADAHSI